MGNKRQGHDDSDSSLELSDEDQPVLQAPRYQAAAVRWGLTTRTYRLFALHELDSLMSCAYSSAPKQLQNDIFEDLKVAVAQPDSCPQVARAKAALVAAAKHLLPQQKRNQLLQEQRRAGVAAHRACRRGPQPGHGGHPEQGSDSDDGAEHGVVFNDVPLEVVVVILRSLDPLTLGAAACVSRCWHQMATSDQLWLPLLEHIFPTAARRHARQQPVRQEQQQQPPQQHQPQEQHVMQRAHGQLGQQALTTLSHHHHQLHQQQSADPSGPHQLQFSCVPTRLASNKEHASPGSGVDAPQSAAEAFAAAARRRPSRLLPWRSCRTLLNNKLCWAPPAAWPSAPCQFSTPGLMPPGGWYLTPAQAVRWMMGENQSTIRKRSGDKECSSSSSTDHGSSSGGDSDCSVGRESHVLPGSRQMMKWWAVRSS